MLRDGKMGKRGLRGEDSCGNLAVLMRGGGRRTSTNNFKSYFFGELFRIAKFESLLYVGWCQCIKNRQACFRFHLFPTFTIMHFAARYPFTINQNHNAFHTIVSFPHLPPSYPFNPIKNPIVPTYVLYRFQIQKREGGEVSKSHESQSRSKILEATPAIAMR